MEIVIVIMVFLVAFSIVYYLGMSSIYRKDKEEEDVSFLLAQKNLLNSYEAGTKGLIESIVIVNSTFEAKQIIGLNTKLIAENYELLRTKIFESGDKFTVQRIVDRIFSSITKEEAESFINELPTNIEFLNKRLKLNYYFDMAVTQLYIYIFDETDYYSTIEEIENKLRIATMTIGMLKQPIEYDERLNRIDAETIHFMEDAYKNSNSILEYKKKIAHGVKSVKLLAIPMQFKNTVDKLQTIYETVVNFPEDGKLLELKHIFPAIEMLDITSQDRNDIKLYIGKDESQNKKISVDRRIFSELEAHVTESNDNDFKMEALKMINRMKFIEINEIVDIASLSVLDMAKILNKKINSIKFDYILNDFDIASIRRSIAMISPLFENAIKHGIESPAQRFRQNKSEAGTISLNIVQEDNMLVLSVMDDGRGIREENLSKVSENFYLQDGVWRGDVRTNDHIADSSVGIISAFTNERGGSMTFESKVGHYTIYRIELPYIM